MFAYCVVDRSISEEQRCRTLDHRTGGDVPCVQPIGTLMTYLCETLFHFDHARGTRRALCLEAVGLGIVCLITERRHKQHVVLQARNTCFTSGAMTHTFLLPGR